MLQAAAVVGMQFWPGAVAAAMGGRPTDAVERSIRRLEHRDLIHEQAASTMAGQTEYTFGHVLVRDHVLLNHDVAAITAEARTAARTLAGRAGLR